MVLESLLKPILMKFGICWHIILPAIGPLFISTPTNEMYIPRLRGEGVESHTSTRDKTIL